MQQSLILTGPDGSATPPRQHGVRAGWAIDAACAALGVTPLLLTAHVPLYDLPNHIAMLHVLLERAGDPALQRIYAVHWAFLPNMGLQVFAWMAAPLMGVEASVRLFCILTVLLLFAGTRALNLVLCRDLAVRGGPGARAYRLTPLLCWGGPMQFGFVTYCFGIGLMLLFLAIYIHLHGRRWAVLIGVFGPLGLLLLATHLMAFCLFVACLAACEAAYALRRPGPWHRRAAWLCGRGLVVAGMLLPALSIWAIAPKLQSSAAPGFHINTLASTLSQKLQAVAAIMWFDMPWVEFPLVLAAIACLGAALLAGLVKPDLRAACMTAVLSAAWLVLPRAVPASFFIDYRVPWAAAFVVLAGLVPGGPMRFGRPALAWRHPRLARGVILAAFLLAGVRIASISARFLMSEPELAQLDRALDKLPHGANLLVVRAIRHEIVRRTPPIEHEAAYYVTSRHGFEDQIFAGVAGQMVRLQPPYLPLYRLKPVDTIDELPDAYQAVLVFFPDLLRRRPDLGLRTIATGPHFLLQERPGL